jgi:sugar phosphate isomerase/epimerase
MFSNICSLDRGLELIFKAACGNCGLMLDSWHLEHIRASPAEIREKISSAEIPIGVEINDGVIWPDAELAEATVHNRLLPGEGRFDLTGFLGVMEQVGYVGPIGIEVLNSALRKQPNDIVPARVFDAAWSVCQNI